MSGNTDKEILDGCLDPRNWGFGRQTFVLVVLVGLAAVTVGLVVAGHSAMGLLHMPVVTGAGLGAPRGGGASKGPTWRLVRRRGRAEAPGRTVFPRRPTGVAHQPVAAVVVDTPAVEPAGAVSAASPVPGSSPVRPPGGSGTGPL